MTPDPRRSDPPAGRVGPGAKSPPRPARCYQCEAPIESPADGRTVTVGCASFHSGTGAMMVRDQGSVDLTFCLKCQGARLAQFETQMKGKSDGNS